MGISCSSAWSTGAPAGIISHTTRGDRSASTTPGSESAGRAPFAFASPTGPLERS